MSISNNRLDRDFQAYRENPNDQGTDRRVADLDAHSRLDSIIDALDGVGGGQAELRYSEISAVAAGTTTIVTYTASGSAFLQSAVASGGNIAEYELLINGSVVNKKRTYFAGSPNVDFNFSKQGSRGIELAPGDIVLIRVTHSRPQVADFNGTIQVYEA